MLYKINIRGISIPVSTIDTKPEGEVVMITEKGLLFANIEKVEERKGEWVYSKTYYDADECNCSLCGQLMTTHKGRRMNYCPNCGANMKKEGEQ